MSCTAEVKAGAVRPALDEGNSQVARALRGTAIHCRLLALTTMVVLGATGANALAADCEDIATPAKWGYSPTLSLLADGRILLVGGRQNDSSDYLDRVEILDLGTRKFTAAASMSVPRALHTAMSLADGRVLVAGGQVELVEVYDPVANRWARIGSMKNTSSRVAIAPTRDGKMLILGGDIGYKGAYSNEAWLWDLKGPLKAARSGDSFAGQAVVTRKYGVLFLGERDGFEFYRDGAGQWTRDEATGKLTRFQLDSQLTSALASIPRGMKPMRTSDGRLIEPLMAHDATHLVEFRGNQWEKTVAFNRDHLAPAVLLLPSGDVLVVGSGPRPLPAELCHRTPAARGPESAAAQAPTSSADKRLGRDFGDRCFVHLKAERWTEATAECERGLAVAKHGKVIGALHFNLGRIAEGQGRIEDARAHYRKSIEARPDNEPAQSRLKALEGK